MFFFVICKLHHVLLYRAFDVIVEILPCYRMHSDTVQRACFLVLFAVIFLYMMLWSVWVCVCACMCNVAVVHPPGRLHFLLDFFFGRFIILTVIRITLYIMVEFLRRPPLKHVDRNGKHLTGVLVTTKLVYILRWAVRLFDGYVNKHGHDPLQ